MLQQAIQAFQSGNFDRADSILKRVLEVDSKNLSVLHILGLIKASQLRYKEATDYLSKAARIDPNDPSLQYNLAKALSDSGSDIEALTHHKKAVELAPTIQRLGLIMEKPCLIWVGMTKPLRTTIKPLL